MKSKSGAGFTLIELLVVIFIISLISGSVLVSSWRNQDQYYASKAAQKLAADFRRVQNMALSGAYVPAGCAPDDCAKGFGLYVKSPNEYVIFYNSDKDKTRYVEDGSKESTDMETITLPNNTSLSPDKKEVYFTPPDPTTYINNGNDSSQAFTIINGSFSKSVTVFIGGRVDIN